MSGIVVDSSAVAAILFDEPERHRLLTALGAADSRAISVFGVLETSVVLSRRFGITRANDGAAMLDAFLRAAAIRSVALDGEQLRMAREAWARFGKGRHAAQLNLGDCCAYAAARALGWPLLCKGDDLPQTDISLVPW